MKKNLIKLSMFLVLSLITSNLFAQALDVAATESKLTDNSKNWTWYMDTPKGSVPKNISYVFDKAHTVTVTTDGKPAKLSWKVTQKPASETSRSMTTTITIGMTAYTLTFGSDKEHPEYLVLKSKLISSYFTPLYVR